MDPYVCAADTLTAREAQLPAEVADIDAASKRTTAGGTGFGRRVSDGTNIAVERITDVAAPTGLQRELAHIAKAKAALATATYASCEACGGEMAAGRRQAHPASTTCVCCAGPAGAPP